MQIRTTYTIEFGRSEEGPWQEFVFNGYREFPTLPLEKMSFLLNFNPEGHYICGSVTEVGFEFKCDGCVEYYALFGLENQTFKTFDDFSDMFLGQNGLLAYFYDTLGLELSISSSPGPDPRNLTETITLMSKEWFDSLSTP